MHRIPQGNGSQTVDGWIDGGLLECTSRVYESIADHKSSAMFCSVLLGGLQGGSFDIDGDHDRYPLNFLWSSYFLIYWPSLCDPWESISKGVTGLMEYFCPLLIKPQLSIVITGL